MPWYLPGDACVAPCWVVYYNPYKKTGHTQKETTWESPGKVFSMPTALLELIRLSLPREELLASPTLRLGLFRVRVAHRDATPQEALPLVGCCWCWRILNIAEQVSFELGNLMRNIILTACSLLGALSLELPPCEIMILRAP